jgi:hypothetical protein
VAQFDSVLKRRGFSPAVSAAKSIAALQFAEKLDLVVAFGWRSGFTAAIARLFSTTASAAEVRLPLKRSLFLIS